MPPQQLPRLSACDCFAPSLDLPDLARLHHGLSYLACLPLSAPHTHIYFPTHGAHFTQSGVDTSAPEPEESGRHGAPLTETPLTAEQEHGAERLKGFTAAVQLMKAAGERKEG